VNDVYAMSMRWMSQSKREDEKMKGTARNGPATIGKTLHTKDCLKEKKKQYIQKLKASVLTWIVFMDHHHPRDACVQRIPGCW